MIRYFIVYLVLVNLVSFVLFAVDKHRAQYNGEVPKLNRRRTPPGGKKKIYTEKRRIPEKTLLGVAAVGGSIGAIAGMWIFHHKTRHWYFVWGLPAIVVLQVLIAWVATGGF